MVSIARFPQAESARRVSQLFGESGIRSLVRDLETTPGAQLRAKTPGVTVEVDAGQFADAMAVLEQAGLLHYSVWAAVACPRCGSRKTEAAATYAYDVPWPWFILSLFLLGLPLLLRPSRLRCVDCGTLFAKPRGAASGG